MPHEDHEWDDHRPERAVLPVLPPLDAGMLVAAHPEHLNSSPWVTEDAAPLLLSLQGSLALMLGERFEETSAHTDRVVHLARQMAGLLAFDEARLEALLWGARLHDIGKLAVPAEVLHKTGPLSHCEWRAMRAHVEAGQAIAESLGVLPWASLCLLAQHHECWDGSGYPAGLRGPEICLEARIFAYCDVYDALIHARSYKAAWSQEQVLTEIRTQAGRHFDPELLDVFLRVVAPVC